MPTAGPQDYILLLAGPGAAAGVLLIVLWGLYSLVVKHLIPAAEATTKRHLDQIDRMLDEHKEERAAMFKTLKGIERTLVAYRPKDGDS